MSELADRIRKEIPESPTNYRIEMNRWDLDTMIRTRMLQAAGWVLEAIDRRKLVFIQAGKDVEIVRVEPIKEFVEGKKNASKS